MGSGLVVLLVVLVCAELVLSCCIAHWASDGRAHWAWGLAGPFGWVVASLVPIRRSLDELVRIRSTPPRGELVRSRTRVDPARAEMEAVEPLPPDEAELAEDGSIVVACRSCSTRDRLFPNPDDVAKCSRCGTVILGYSRSGGS